LTTQIELGSVRINFSNSKGTFEKELVSFKCNYVLVTY